MSEKRSIGKVIVSLLLNKYTIVIVIYLIFITFFDNHSLLLRWKTQGNLSELKKEHNYYIDEIKKNKDEINKLKTNNEYLEKVAREKYQMKKDNEDIFIVK